jgi:hypothetical protein
MWRINNTFGYAVKCGHIAGQERPIFESCAARFWALKRALHLFLPKPSRREEALNTTCAFVTASKDPCKELLLEGIELTDVLFVSAVMGFALRHPQSRQLLALSFDKVGVGNIEHPCCSTEK